MNSESEQDLYCPSIKAFGLDLPIDDYYSRVKDRAKQYYSELRFFTYKMDPEIKAQLLSAKMSYVLLDKIIFCRYFLYEIKCEIDKVTNPAFKKALEHLLINIIKLVDKSIVLNGYNRNSFSNSLSDILFPFLKNNATIIHSIHHETEITKTIPNRTYNAIPVNQEEKYKPNLCLYHSIIRKIVNIRKIIVLLNGMTNTRIHELIKKYVAKFTHFTSDYPSSKPYYCSENITPELELYFGEQEKYLFYIASALKKMPCYRVRQELIKVPTKYLSNAVTEEYVSQIYELNSTIIRLIEILSANIGDKSFEDEINNTPLSPLIISTPSEAEQSFNPIYAFHIHYLLRGKEFEINIPEINNMLSHRKYGFPFDEDYLNTVVQKEIQKTLNSALSSKKKEQCCTSPKKQSENA